MPINIFLEVTLLRPFGDESDIDLVIVSEYDFLKSWEKLRTYHRKNWYRIGHYNQIALRRSGENVYSGFVTLKWIPDYYEKTRIDYEELSNKYSNETVGYKEVNIMYFKNSVELVDYYIRSFRIIKGL